MGRFADWLLSILSVTIAKSPKMPILSFGATRTFENEQYEKLKNECDIDKTLVFGYSYASELLFNVSDVQKELKNGLDALAVLGKFTQDKGELDAKYAKDLFKLVSSVHPDSLVSNGLKEPFRRFVSMHNNIAQYHETLSSALCEDIAKSIHDIVKKQKREMKDIENLLHCSKVKCREREASYRKRSTEYTKKFNEACVAYANARDENVPATVIESGFSANRYEASLSLDAIALEDTNSSKIPFKRSASEMPTVNSSDNGKKKNPRIVAWLLPNRGQQRESVMELAIDAIKVFCLFAVEMSNFIHRPLKPPELNSHITGKNLGRCV